MVLSNAPAMLLRTLCLAVAAEAYSVVTTSCSTPNATANFVGSPDARGTLDILWSSLFTIIACTWTAQHPNVPEQRIHDMPYWGWQLRQLRQSAWRMILTVLAPEILVSLAWHDLESARENHKSMQEFQDAVEWTLAHSFYANMGGFVIRGNPSDKADDPYHLDADDVFALRQENMLRTLPDISTEELSDKSEGDWLVKGIAVCQILWTTLQIGVRLSEGLGVSQLEVAVLAFAVCALIIYAVYWSKPKCVDTATTICKYEGHIPDGILELLERRKRSRMMTGYLPSFLWSPDQGLPGSPIAFDEYACKDDGRCTGLVASAITTSLFGGVHLLAWNFVFPTAVDRWLWRAASIYSAVFGAILMIQRLIPSLPRRSLCFNTCFFDACFDACLKIAACVYIVARLIIMVEIFRTLFFLPPDVFVSTWTSYLPHFG